MKPLRRDHVMTYEAVVQAFLAVVILGALAYLILRTIPGVPSAVGVAPVTELKIAPASGVAGFDASLFCADPLTTVKALPAPDAVGITYQLVRVRDGKAETVVVVTGARNGVIVATHYMDASTGQVSEPAIVNADARACIEKKAK